MLHHLSTDTTKFETSRACSDAALEPLGFERMVDMADGNTIEAIVT